MANKQTGKQLKLDDFIQNTNKSFWILSLFDPLLLTVQIEEKPSYINK
jgi:hypothetical protein